LKILARKDFVEAIIYLVSSKLSTF